MAKAAGLWRNRCGGTAVMFALAMPVLIGALGLGFEVTNWYMTQRGMQAAADAAVLAAASNGGGNYDIEGKAVAAQLGFTDGADNVAVTLAQQDNGNQQNNGPAPGQCYTATITNAVPLYLSPVVGFIGDGGGNQSLAATATACTSTAGTAYCVLALTGNGGNGGGPGIIGNGGSNNMSGCSIKSNTSAICNGTNLGADYGDTVGRNQGCGRTKRSGLQPTADPYSYLAANIPPDTCAGFYPRRTSSPALVTKWSGTRSLSGNVPICGDLKLTSDVTVNAPSGAVVVLYNGSLDTNGFKIQTMGGSGLTIVFAGSSGGGYAHGFYSAAGTVEIAAPTSGPWSGVAIYQDPSLTSGVDVTLNGSGRVWKITGLVYLPHAQVIWNGVVNQSGNNLACFVLVMDHLIVNGSIGVLPSGGCAIAGLTMPTENVPGRPQLVD